ncbi:MAG TPA: GNAT family N-acetyltransferase [Candidatus Bathyarchaeia archaeon]|nr:GNAT family N-acetyltransferase [Candidatus Bathyarchaeia archaeon]
MNIVTVNEENVSEKGFFCYMSKKKTPGYQRKLRWLKERFDEGMQIKMLDLAQGGRGFVEYIPGGFAWRAVSAKGYMFIHCIWIAGKSRGKGYGSLFLNECIKDARKSGMKGVAMITSEKNWLVEKKFLMKHGFESVAQYPPFELMVKKFTEAPPPSFTGDFEQKLKNCGSGLTIIRSDQCPYIDAAVNAALEAAKELGIKTQTIELKNSEDVRKISPSPYGVFQIVYNRKLLTYHSLAKKDLTERLRTSTPPQ